MTEWNKDISLAPKDGSTIVAHDALTGTSHVTYWEGSRWYDPDRHYYSETPEFNPSLWFSLPDLPSLKESK